MEVTAAVLGEMSDHEWKLITDVAQNDEASKHIRTLLPPPKGATDSGKPFLLSGMPPLRKLLVWLLVIFGLYAILTSPQEASRLVDDPVTRVVGSALGGTLAVVSVISFVRDRRDRWRNAMKASLRPLMTAMGAAEDAVHEPSLQNRYALTAAISRAAGAVRAHYRRTRLGLPSATERDAYNRAAHRAADAVLSLCYDAAAGDPLLLMGVRDDLARACLRLVAGRLDEVGDLGRAEVAVRGPLASRLMQSARANRTSLLSLAGVLLPAVVAVLKR